VKAVLFDVYGTLLISASGDIGAASATARAIAIREAFAAMTLPEIVSAETVSARMIQTIQESHDRSRAAGIEHPEVDIVKVWKHVIGRLVADDLLPPRAQQIDVSRLALEYEVRVNPVWPMPGLPDCLQQLHSRGICMGLVSNAQRFTVELFPALLNRTLEELGVDPELQWLSYRYGRAKPDPWLFELARAGLAERGFAAQEVLCVGNDRLNDVWPAARVGFRTALFAGDVRSFRPRDDDPRVASIVPDLIITELSQLPQCLET
jgi:putative hydrolase of the HAD superfamily